MKRCIQLVGLLSLLAAFPLSGALIVYSSPDAAYLSTFNRLLPITAPDGAMVGFVANGPITATFSSEMMASTVPFTWGTWGSPPDTEGDTPRVLDSLGLWTVSIDLTGTVYGFGFEAEPMLFDVFNMTAYFYSGGTYLGSISRDVNGYYGARLFAAYSTELGQPITRIDFLTLPNAAGFGLAQFRTAELIPEPSTFWMLAAGILALAGSRRWRRR